MSFSSPGHRNSNKLNKRRDVSPEFRQDKPKQKVSPRAICEEPHVKDRSDNRLMRFTWPTGYANCLVD